MWGGEDRKSQTDLWLCKMNSCKGSLKVTLPIASLQWHTEKEMAKSLTLSQLNENTPEVSGRGHRSCFILDQSFSKEPSIAKCLESPLKQ